MKERMFYVQLVRMLGFVPRKRAHYKLAFLPKSANAGLNSSLLVNNERLEYLGDAILDAIVADYLFKRFPEDDEGFLTKLRARIVKRKNLDYLAKQLHIPDLISSGILPGNESKHLYGNTLEALIGAIYLDRGYRITQRFFIKKILNRHIDLVQLVKKDPDYKSRIIEWAQKNRIEILFETTEENPSGQKSPLFVSTISLNGEKKGTGRGSVKKDAEQHAAKEAFSSTQTLQ
ncbi:MAG: ribonuclease III domain-containing protein [Bacteroidota bacterium]